MIRTATVKDVPQIARLIAQFAERGKMLFRSHAELYETVRDFVVCEQPGPTGVMAIVGVCALEIVWADLAEVKSLAVDPAFQGKGIGKQLVKATTEEARRLQIQRVFALTYEQAFFEKLGFAVVDKSALPLKVWSACIKCPKRDGCDEIAVVKTMFDKPALEEGNPDDQAGLRYDVPTPLVQLGSHRVAGKQ
jgi:amino-acid N-acetyltransferase